MAIRPMGQIKVGSFLRRLKFPGWRGKGLGTNTPNHVLRTEAMAGRRVIAVTAFGMSGEAMEEVLATVDTVCRRKRVVPVILTDWDKFDGFCRRGLAYEYLPPPDLRDRYEPDLDWSLYFARRLELFWRKWRPCGIISFGERSPVDGFKERLSVLADG